MKNREFVALAIALSMTVLAGCGRDNRVKETAAPVVTPAPTSQAEPVAAPTAEPVAAPTAEPETRHQVGERYEGTVTLDGMAQPVWYEQIRNDTLGFEMGYGYERFERHSSPERERFVLKGEDPEHPEVYLEITRSAEDAETTAASIGESLSNEYNIFRGAFTLDHAGDCIKINADVDKNGQTTIDHLQVVYIIPAAGGCLVAWGHNGFDSSDAFGALYRNMMHTLVVLDGQANASGPFAGVMGSKFTVPEGFVQLDESPSIGYQYTFWHPEHEIRIVVNEIAPGYIPEGAYEVDRDNARNNPDVAYFNEGENWFVQSGYHNGGEEIFYAKESATDNGLKSFQITYPTARREFGDSVTAEFEASFSF